MKKNIIDISMLLFLNQGFKSVTMDDIANEMGISKKTIYAHFENKTKLIEAVAFQLFSQICFRVETISIRSKNPIEELYSIIIYVTQYLKDEKSSTQNQLKKYYFKIHQTLKFMVCEKIHLYITDCLRRGLEIGVFKHKINTDFISRMFYLGMKSINDDISFPPNKYQTHYLIECYTEYHLQAIVSKKGKKMLNNLTKINEPQ